MDQRVSESVLHTSMRSSGGYKRHLPDELHLGQLLGTTLLSSFAPPDGPPIDLALDQAD